MTGNWKLKDKKSIKALADELERAQASIKEKLGDEWTLVINWEAIGAATSDKDDREPGTNIIERVCANSSTSTSTRWTRTWSRR